MKIQKRYKFLRTGFKSENGNHKWIVGRWYKFDGELELCKSGFHSSKGIYQAFSYVQGEILAEVEVKGKHLSDDTKEVWSQMRVVKTWKWAKKDSVLFAIFAARLVLKYFEEKYPADDRPRKAIEAAEKWIKYPTKKNSDAARDAAWAAWAARAARDARAAWAAWAAWAARDAAWAAWAAWVARDAAWAAGDAAWATGDAAWAARAAIYKKCDLWMLKHLKELKELKHV